MPELRVDLWIVPQAQPPRLPIRQVLFRLVPIARSRLGEPEEAAAGRNKATEVRKLDGDKS